MECTSPSGLASRTYAADLARFHSHASPPSQAGSWKLSPGVSQRVFIRRAVSGWWHPACRGDHGWWHTACSGDHMPAHARKASATGILPTRRVYNLRWSRFCGQRDANFMCVWHEILHQIPCAHKRPVFCWNRESLIQFDIL